MSVSHEIDRREGELSALLLAVDLPCYHSDGEREVSLLYPSSITTVSGVNFSYEKTTDARTVRGAIFCVRSPRVSVKTRRERERGKVG